MWWMWALMFDGHTGPKVDHSGRECAERQEGPVWFLPYSPAQQGQVACVVPEGKYVLLPIMANLIELPGTPPYATCAAMLGRAKAAAESVRSMSLELNGRDTTKELTGYWNKNCFSVVAPAPFVAAMSGAFAVLAPLPAGEQLVRLKVDQPSGSRRATYRLVVR